MLSTSSSIKTVLFLAATLALAGLGSAWVAAVVDSDGDGLPDVWEFQNGYDELDGTDALKDLDADGLSGREEFAWGTRGDRADTDRDQQSDGREVFLGKSPVLPKSKVLSAANAHTCVLGDSGVVCGGNNYSGETSVPSLENPIAVSAGVEQHTCAIDETGVVCWGNSNDGRTTVPALTNPVDVSAGAAHTCALDDSGIVCWGNNWYGQLNVPPLSNPTEVSAGERHTCAVDDTGVVCWGHNGSGQTNAPPLSNPTAVSAGSKSHSCAVDDTGVVCWGRGTEGQITVPSLSNPVAVSAGGYHTCAVDDTGVVCWGSNTVGQANVPPLSNPVEVSAGFLHTCALDDRGVVCWGSNINGESTVPLLSVTSSRLYAYARTFPRMAKLSDINVDLVSDIAVVRRSPLRAEIRSGSSGSLLRVILLFDGKPVPLDLAALSDIDGNGSSELAVLAWSNGAFAAQIVNVGSGASAARTVTFASTLKEYRGFTTAPDINANGAPELVLMAKDAAGQTIVQLKDSATGATTATVSFGSTYNPIGIEVVEDQDGGGVPDLAMVGINSTGRVRAQIKDPITKALVGGTDFEKTYPALHTVSLDLDGDGQKEVLGVLGENTVGFARTQLRRLPDGAVVSKALFGRGFTSHELFTIPDQNGNGQPELVVLQSPGPKGIAHIRDAGTGAVVKQVGFVTRGMPRDAVYLPPSPVSAVGEIAYLSEEAGKLTLQTRATLSGTRRLNIALSTTAPSYTVSTQPGAGGNISPISAQIQLGQSTMFTVTPDASHSIGSVSGCSGNLAGNTYTTGVITEPCTVAANFTPLPAASFAAIGFKVGSPAPAGTQMVVGVRLTNPDGSDPGDVAVNYTLPSGVTASGSLSCTYSSTQKRRTCSLTVTPTAAGTYNVPFTATRSGELPAQFAVSITAT